MPFIKRNRKLFILLSLILALSLSACTDKQKKERSPQQKNAIKDEDSFRIGMLVPLQGLLKKQGANLKRGALVAETLINQNKAKNEKNLKVIFRDTRSEVSLASELTKDLIDKEKIKVLTGTISEQSTLNAINETTVPFIYTSNGRVKTCSSDNTRETATNIWGLGLSEQMVTEPFLINLSELFREQDSSFKISYFNENNDSNEIETSFFEQIAESLDFSTTGHIRLDTRIDDSYEKIQDIISQNPDVLFISTSKSRTKSFLNQATKLGVKQDMKITGLNSFKEEDLREFEDYADDVISVSSYTSDLENKENLSFLSIWKEMFPEEPKPTATAARGFAAVTVIATAIKKMKKNKEFSSLDFNASLNNLEVALPQGKIFISAKNHLAIQPLFSTIFKDKNFTLLKFLGNVSHPQLEGCSAGQTEEATIE